MAGLDCSLIKHDPVVEMYDRPCRYYQHDKHSHVITNKFESSIYLTAPRYFPIQSRQQAAGFFTLISWEKKKSNPIWSLNVTQKLAAKPLYLPSHSHVYTPELCRLQEMWFPQLKFSLIKDPYCFKNFAACHCKLKVNVHKIIMVYTKYINGGFYCVFHDSRS